MPALSQAGSALLEALLAMLLAGALLALVGLVRHSLAHSHAATLQMLQSMPGEDRPGVDAMSAPGGA